MTEFAAVLKKVGFRGASLYTSVVFLALLLINLIFSAALVGPLESGAETLSAEVRVLKARVADNARAPLPVRALEARGDIDRYKARLPKESELISVVAAVDKAALMSKLVISKSDYESVSFGDTDIGIYKMTFSIEGPYKSIKKFIYSIETFEYPLSVEEIVFSRSRAEEGTVELKMSLNAFYR